MLRDVKIHCLGAKITSFVCARRVTDAILGGGTAAKAIPLGVLRPPQAVRLRAVVIGLHAPATGR